MQKLVRLAGVACFLLSLALPLGAEPVASGSPAPATGYSPAGVRLGDYVLRPGEALAVVMGVLGPPDHLRPMRSKEEKDDYVMLNYYTKGISLDIDGRSNCVQGILVESRQVKLEGVPFALGDSQQAVLTRWGQPEKTAAGVLAYWRRGVYVGVDDQGRLINFYLAPPGKVDEATDQGPSPSPTPRGR